MIVLLFLQDDKWKKNNKHKKYKNLSYLPWLVGFSEATALTSGLCLLLNELLPFRLVLVCSIVPGRIFNCLKLPENISGNCGRRIKTSCTISFKYCSAVLRNSSENFNLNLQNCIIMICYSPLKRVSKHILKQESIISHMLS